MRKLFVVISVMVVVFSISASVIMAQDLCEGNFDCDEDVDGTDAALFKTDFGRSPFQDPCPPYEEPFPCNPCPYGMVDCGTKCVDPLTDEDFCGVDSACLGGAVCKTSERCVLGVCELPSLPCEGTLSPLGRWCDQEDGTVKDMTTGLVWLKKADWGGGRHWVNCIAFNDAHTRAAQLWDGSPYEGTAGLSDGSIEGDWRLPTKTELYNLANGTEAVRTYSMQFFTGVQSGGYWSSTTHNVLVNVAYYVYMELGIVEGYGKEEGGFYVLPVRGGH